MRLSAWRRSAVLDRSLYPTRAEESVAAELSAVRPSLDAAYAAALPGARAAVLTRLWRGLAHDPLPWVRAREETRDGLTLRLADGSRLHGPLPDPYATDAYVDQVELDGVPYRQPARLVTALGVAHATEFAVELDDSTASLALSRAGRGPVRPDLWPDAGWQWEQRVVDGHPYHPNCRSRPGFTVAEQLAYAPEHGPVVELGVVPVPPRECLVAGDWPRELRDGDRILVPVHPWQARHVLKSPVEPGTAAHPLMALRTLAPAGGGGPHVKTALSTRLTSSVRDMSVYSVENAEAVSAFVESLAARLEGRLHITRTVGAVSAYTPDLAALLREPPERFADAERGERVVPVAALTTTDLVRSASWLADFARLALTVCLRVLELGVALEAHGQNLLVVLGPDGAPLRLVYRDLADIRISPARLGRHGIAVPPIAGRMVTDDVAVLRRKLFGSLVSGALGATAGSAAALGAALAAAAPALPPGPDREALVARPLPVKALTLMRLSPGVPGDLWTEVANPLG
ncbi:IucA/IucC family siderophore biosynthesis protein [Streptomyces antimicrobicus]|uniref:IucA/IucC family siderophore biosynthesis protein n=1 Tax=Streptomyces antimicrobicus TaxID=2883108 RepID=A0ABS8BAZ8_9ACTN|nr:IucA/IucC family siderophore biosynthesis protein [Streptomyces antimicrobicus]MCB5181802.1 IucA/IucC family siderophore biosynthesis protein [Streptomyces antimicrobicus]